MSVLLGGTRSKYSRLVADLQNLYILGVDQYPRDVEEAYDMMLSYSLLVGNAQYGNKEIKELYTTGIFFYQSLEPTVNSCDKDSNKEVVAGVSGNVFKNILCYSCNRLGHYSNDCPQGNNQQSTKKHKQQQEAQTTTRRL